MQRQTLQNMSKFFYVYILYSQKDHKIYIGFTTDLISRINEHQIGKVTATVNRLPVILIHYEAFSDISDAKARERYLKSGYGRKNLKKELQNIFKKVNYTYK